MTSIARVGFGRVEGWFAGAVPSGRDVKTLGEVWQSKAVSSASGV